MAFALGSRHALAYVAESTFGTTPGSPSMKSIRHTGTTLDLNKETFVSNEIRSDRQIPEFRHGTKQIGGDIAFEFSYGAFDDLLEAALQGTWTTNVLKAGTTAKFFTIERRLEDLAKYFVYTGCMVDQLSLKMEPNAMVTGSFGIIGKDSAAPSGTSLGSPTAVASFTPFDAFTGALSEGGSAIASVTSLDIKLDNGLSPAFVIGSSTTPQIISGRSNLTGSLTAYFESEALYNKFRAETESSLSVTLDGPSGDYTILIPRIKYSGAKIDVKSAEDGVMIEMPFQAIRDSTEATNIKITRVP